ncbi:hypothetical protein, partial [Microbispora triticiradicis]|uniref:hypothetical protein n=1 Tax=Microbispora triticiradicis TaxID=2200763 RepID=UPI001AD80AC0
MVQRRLADLERFAVRDWDELVGVFGRGGPEGRLAAGPFAAAVRAGAAPVDGAGRRAARSTR